MDSSSGLEKPPLAASDAESGDGFGGSVTSNGDTLVAGAPQAGGVGNPVFAQSESTDRLGVGYGPLGAGRLARSACPGPKFGWTRRSAG